MITIKDIARNTGRSVSTVSVVLRGDAERFGIRPETAEEIRRTAAELGYVRNDYARTMVCGKSRVLGFISGNRSGVEYSGRLLSGALESASEREYSLRVFRYDPAEPEILAGRLLSQQIRGILISGDLGREQADQIILRCREKGIRCATVNLSNQVEGFGIVSDDIGGMSEMVRMLHERGHRRIGMLSTPSEAEFARKRRIGYRRGMRQCGLTPAVFPACGENTPDLSDWVEAGFTAVMCDTDTAAAKLMQQAYVENIRVPDTISICGFAGMQVADFAALPLTTVAQDFEGMGETAAALLIAALETGKAPARGQIENTSVSTRIHIQKTTKGI